MRGRSSILGIAAVAAIAAASMPGGAEIIQRDTLSGEPLFPPARPSAFGGKSGRSRIKGNARPAGSKLARKAARGKL